MTIPCLIQRWRKAPVVGGGISLCSGRKPSAHLFSTGPPSNFTDRSSLTRDRTTRTLWTLVWALSSIALMQVAYWVSHRVRPPLPQFTNAPIGHAVLFLARIGFVLPTSFFGFVFVAQRPEFEISAFQYLVILLGLFSLYCYVRDLERLGRAFIAREKGLDATAR
jgi:hypothetical protein